MNSLSLLPFLLLLPAIECFNLNNFIKKIDYELDYKVTCMHEYYNRVPVGNDLTLRYFESQLQDHYDALNRNTWRQTYFIHNPTGKVSDVAVVLVGGEGPAGDMFNFFEKLLPEMAQTTMTFTVAHRYYQPGDNVNPTKHFNASTDSRLLSSKQALADLEYFIQHVVMGDYKFKKPPIIMGCSYPGSLTVWFREKYPHLSLAGIALSAPIRAFDNFHQYLEVGEQAVKDLFPKCYPQLVSGKKILQYAAANNGTGFGEQLNLCTDTGFRDWITIFTIGWMMVSKAFAAGLGQSGRLYHAQKICITLDESGPFIFLRDIMYLRGRECNDPQRIIDQEQRSPIDKEIAHPEWFWQKCSEFGWFKTHSDDSLFALFPLDAYHKVCKDDYCIDTDLLHTVLDQTNNFYGSTNITGLTKLLILNGADDPWHTASMYEFGEDYNGVVSKIIQHAHHCTFIDYRFTDEAKQIAKEAVDTWLK